MPITGAHEQFRELTQLAATHGCPEHPKYALQVAWDGQSNCYVIRCREHDPDQVQPLESYTQMYKRGTPLPQDIADKVESNLKRRRQTMNRKAQAVEIIEADTGQLAPAPQIQKAIEYAHSLSLDPLLGHVCLYHGEPWVTIDGWYYRLRRKLPRACLESRPLTDEERKARRVEDHQHAWVAFVYEYQGGKLLATGYGDASKDKPWHRSAVEVLQPQRLAEKRAEEDAIRKVVPPGIDLAPTSEGPPTREVGPQGEPSMEENSDSPAEAPAASDEGSKEAETRASPATPARPAQPALTSTEKAPAEEKPKAPPRLLEVWLEIKAALSALPKGSDQQAARWLAKESNQEVSAKVFERPTPPVGMPGNLLFKLSQEMKKTNPA